MERGDTTRVVGLTVNSREYTTEVNANETLADVLREKLQLTGTKKGCEQGECGSCTVLINGEPVLSCMLLAIECEGVDITTIEGLSNPKTGELHILQKAFIENGGIQCGFCTPSMILAAKALLDRNLSPTDEEIREAINGSICRCTGYMGIIASIKVAAEGLRKERRQ
jgi:carbon-monoxide dehydrogenase small subunit